MKEEFLENNEKKEIKKTINKLSLGVLIYLLIMYIIVNVDILIKYIKLYIQNNGDGNLEQQFEQVINSSMLSGLSSIISIFIGFIFLLFFFKKFRSKDNIFQKNSKMTRKSFLNILFVFMSIQIIFYIFSIIIEILLNLIGYSMVGEIENASSSSQTISMFLYASLFAPISEELIFRGFILRGLQKYGKMFAIIMSAIFFGIFHGNFIQGIFAFFVGLVLGYIATNYSIKWSILMHIINNFVFGEAWAYLLTNFSDEKQIQLSFLLHLIFLVGSLIVIARNQDIIKEYIKKINLKNKKIIYVLTSFWFILYLAFGIFEGTLGLQKL